LIQRLDQETALTKVSRAEDTASVAARIVNFDHDGTP